MSNLLSHVVTASAVGTLLLCIIVAVRPITKKHPVYAKTPTFITFLLQTSHIASIDAVKRQLYNFVM